METDMFRRISPFDQMLDSLFRLITSNTRGLLPSGTSSALAPAGDRWADPKILSRFHRAMECFRRDELLVLRAELPGVDSADVDVNVTGNEVTIRGWKREQREADEADLYVREISHGRFQLVHAARGRAGADRGDPLNQEPLGAGGSRLPFHFI